jgi:hypothetical protein
LTALSGEKPLFVAEEVDKLRDYDVMLGHFGPISTLPGNKNYRSLLLQYKDEYKQAKYGEKSNVARKVFQTIADAVPAGRFVEKEMQGTMKTVSPERVVRSIWRAFKYHDGLEKFPTEKVGKLGNTDVLVGLSGPSTTLPAGNKNYRSLISRYSVEYEQTNRRSKTGIARKLVEEISQANGRFVEKDTQGKMITVSRERVLAKVRQALANQNRRVLEKVRKALSLVIIAKIVSQRILLFVGEPVWPYGNYEEPTQS